MQVLLKYKRQCRLFFQQIRKVDFDYAQRYIPVNRAMKAYSDLGAEPSTFTTKQLQNAKSGMSVSGKL